MARKKKYQQAIEYQIQDSLIDIELKALSVVLDRETLPMLRTKTRLQAFRDAMMTGFKQGKKEAVPHEIVEDEYLVMCDALNSLEKAVDEATKVVHKICLTSRRAKLFSQAFPCPPKMFKEFRIKISSGQKREVIAKELVTKRLSVSETTVKNAVNHKRPRRYETSPEQRLLVSLFLDASSLPHSTERLALQTMILDTLLVTGFRPIAIYYVIQACHSLSGLISLEVDNYGIEQLCNSIYPKHKYGKGQFSQLLSDK